VLTHQQADSVWVSDLAGASEVTRVEGVLYSGFVGRVRYRCDDPDVARIVDPLFRLAPFAGVGSKTAWGLGAARLEARWAGAATGSGNRH
jgi:CRISPR-associated endoribonuclease Cas6